MVAVDPRTAKKQLHAPGEIACLAVLEQEKLHPLVAAGIHDEDGVAVYAPDGTMIGRILLPERCANVCFGGQKRNRLFMAASQSIYALYVETQGVLGG